MNADEREIVSTVPGYKGVETCELAFDACRVPAAQLLGGEPGRGFQRTVIARQLVERGLPWV